MRIVVGFEGSCPQREGEIIIDNHLVEGPDIYG